MVIMGNSANVYIQVIDAVRPAVTEAQKVGQYHVYHEPP